MTISSLTLAFVQYGSTADMARTRSVAAPAPAAAVQAAPAPAANDTSCGHREPCDSPRRSPLYRALIDALGSLAQSAPPAPATAGTAAAASAAPAITTDAAQAAGATAPAADAPVDLEDAVMNFARALMQALRGTDQSDEGRRTHGHHHHHHEHHDNGRRAWGDPAQRIDQLAAQVGTAAAPAAAQGADVVAAAASSAAPLTAAAAATPPADAGAPTSGDASPAATPATPATSAPTSVIYVQIQLNGAVAPAAPLGRAQQGLLDAFGSLQKALGLPATDGAAGLQSQLGAFLNALADKLRASDANTASATTQPGALLNVSA